MKDIHYRSSRSTIKPAEIDICKNTVYLRTDIQKDPNDSTFWIYQEAALPREEFAEYSQLMAAKKAINDESQLDIMDAIADLYDMISNITGGVSS